MPKLKLTPDPTFRAKVQIHVPGKGTAPVEFTFRYKNTEALQQYLEGVKDAKDVDIVMEVACGWDLDDAFDRDNVAKLIETYYGSAAAISKTYIETLTGSRLGN